MGLSCPRVTRRLVTVAAASALVLIAALAEAAEGRITVTGSGTVTAAPELAVVSVSVTEQDASARVAMRRNSEAMARVLQRLGDLGIAARDIQTSRISLTPLWSRRSTSSGENRITGYAAENTLQVRVRDLERLGEILDLVLDDGANGFGGLRFGLDDPVPMQDAARAAAVRDAIRQAQLLAEAAGIGLGPIISLSSGGGGGPVPQMMRAEMAAADQVPIAPGELTFGASVTMVFAIAE